jgi:hypothetical protein
MLARIVNIVFMGRMYSNGNEELWGLAIKTMGQLNGGVERCLRQSL